MEVFANLFSWQMTMRLLIQYLRRRIHIFFEEKEEENIMLLNNL